MTERGEEHHRPGGIRGVFSRGGETALCAIILYSLFMMEIVILKIVLHPLSQSLVGYSFRKWKRDKNSITHWDLFSNFDPGVLSCLLRTQVTTFNNAFVL